MKSLIEIKKDLIEISDIFEFEEIKNVLKIRFNSTDTDRILKILPLFYKYENMLEIQNLSNIWLDLKGIEKDTLEAIISYTMTYTETIDPIMILNLLNLIKNYNTLNDEFFNDKHVYFNNLVEYLDIKITLKKQLKEFIKTIGIKFYSLVKSCNKIQDNATSENLENLYNMIFSSIDFMTLCGILSNGNDFSTDECYTIKNANTILYNLIEKSYLNNELLDIFLKGINNDKHN